MLLDVGHPTDLNDDQWLVVAPLVRAASKRARKFVPDIRTVIDNQFGVPHSILVEALAARPLAAPLAMTKIARRDGADYSPDFSLQWALKGINLALDTGGSAPPGYADGNPTSGHTVVELERPLDGGRGSPAPAVVA
jgi:hypothetical protein